MRHPLGDGEIILKKWFNTLINVLLVRFMHYYYDTETQLQKSQDLSKRSVCHVQTDTIFIAFKWDCHENEQDLNKQP